MRHKDSIFALLAGWVVAGCAYAPGPSLDASRMQEAPKDGAPAPTYAVHQIDANVISGQLRATAEAMPLPPQSAGQPHDDYRVGRGDILGITVWGHPELSVGAAATAPLPQLDGMAALGNGA
ncbi:polysaccharide biosynthesis/export family protein, partial [Burkholderia gladioli]